jgi:predicted TPR repeat methyltransferase
MHAEMFQTLAKTASSGDIKGLIAALNEVRAEHQGDPQFIYWDGLAAARSNQLDEAILLLSECANAAPNVPAPRYELGNALARKTRYADAALAFESALLLNPGHVPAWINLGFARLHLDDFHGSEAAFNTARSTDKNFVEAWTGLATLYERAGLLDRAAEQFFETRARFGPNQDRDSELTRLLIVGGQTARAAEFQRTLLAETPGHVNAAHLLAGLEGKSHPRASDQYVQSLFDSYASYYDQHMVGGMQYALPADVAARIAKDVAAQGAVLDLGCGTGLLGAELIKIGAQNRNLVGVDLSPNMLQLARARGYKSLYCEEIESFLGKQTAPSFAAVVACELCIYFGDVATLISSVAKCLEPGGMFYFNVEAGDGAQSYQQGTNGRYTHGAPYICELLEKAGLSVQLQEPIATRLEKGALQDGVLYVAKKLEG